MAHQLFQLPKATLFNSGVLQPGWKVEFFLTTTTTPTPVYTTSALSVSHTQPVEADAAGILPAIYLNPSILYKVSVYDEDDVLVYTIDPANDSILSQAAIGALLYPQTAAETSAGVTPTDYAFPPGDVRRQSVTNDSSTDHTAAFQAVVDAAAGVVPVHVYKTQASGYIRIAGRITAPANTHIILHDEAEIRWTATAATGSSFLGVATRPGIEVTGDNFRIEGSGKLVGPTTAAIVTNECAIFAKGTSTSSRKSGFFVGSIEIYNWGSYGTLCQFVDKCQVMSAKVHDVGYSGIQFISCSRWYAMFNEVYGITPGISGDAYGISGSHDSTAYDADSEVLAGRQKTATNPFCIDGHIDYNTIYDVPLWRAVDFHGGFECSANFNRIYNTKYPIGMCSSSGDAAGYAGENNQVIGNTITSKKKDGSATTVASLDGVAIVLNGGATVKQSNITCVDNTIDGYGLNSASSFSITATNTRNATVCRNKFRNWERVAIYSSEGDGVLAGNIFDAVANASNSRCVQLDGGTYGWTLSDNRHQAHGGTVAAEGLRIGSGTARPIYHDNDFSQATTPYVDVDGAAISPAQITGNTDNYNPTGWSNNGKVLRLSTDASRNLTGLVGGYDGREAEIYNVGAQDLVLLDDSTSTAANCFKFGANITLGANEGIVLRYDGTSLRWRSAGKHV